MLRTSPSNSNYIIQIYINVLKNYTRTKIALEEHLLGVHYVSGTVLRALYILSHNHHVAVRKFT